jgi:tetraacyldisaccharide 4'-kinase
MKFILLPLSWVYGLITACRNYLYSIGVFSSYHSKLPTIVIGNLQVGGSGKTPLTALIFEYLSSKYSIAILSRGYGRKSKGLYEADQNSSPDRIGDEPFWYKQTLKDARVVVSESRKNGLQYLENSNTNLVLLDDAFQHRAIQGDVNVVLTEYSKPFTQDYMLPYGRLREYKIGYKRADILIVSKCPDKMKLEDKIEWIHKLNLRDSQEVYFTGIKALQAQSLKGNRQFNPEDFKTIKAVCGIANPNSFEHQCLKFDKQVELHAFKDHHDYTISDIEKIIETLNDDTIVMVTEKDAVKLSSPNLYKLLPENKVFVLPIKTYFLFNEQEKFFTRIKSILNLQSTTH